MISIGGTRAAKRHRPWDSRQFKIMACEIDTTVYISKWLPFIILMQKPYECIDSSF